MNEFNKFERARIIGARALQLSMDAPLLIKKPENEFNPINLARMEFKKNVIPITIKRD
ncbi:DNA-directed RNA polymerase subunit K [archaeon CG_4_8_14_3_um_filter_38_5]|nr:MAG: DNA-directed RNA polymerase subunit K [archaeon CG07_land_8_20_14_0_80_38_8]PIX42365.1 MAG: DNA-directed RNA polymerase subunit K [archaeon CG_4_8_14_3_um_filter_38_5]